MADDNPFIVPAARHRVPFDGSFRLPSASAAKPDDVSDRADREKRLDAAVDRLEDFQRVLFADDQYSLLLVFQAMDAAGKDGTIRAVMSGVNPAGCQVHSFKQPSAEELDHDFLWRTAVRLPERGRIGIFNRSYYEEVLVVRVHPEYLESQRLPRAPDLDTLWEQRYASIRDHELHLARNGTVVLKFWLNVSRNEQRQRFLDRIDEPEKNWKFSAGDVKERAHWDAYMEAYEAALNATSRPWAPWYAIPADSKSYMRMAVAETIVETLEAMGLAYPEVEDHLRERFDDMRSLLDEEGE
jgi:PPK2 family polyphosphate:nucleotide phosphotransferase